MRKLIAILLVAVPCLGDVLIPPPPEKTVTRMRITVTTGAEDLAEGSMVSAFVVLKNGLRITSSALNCAKNHCDALAPKSKTTFVWPADQGTPFARDEIRRFGLTFEGRKGDEWALAALEVDVTAGGRTKTLLKLDRPVRYFDGSGTWESPAMR